MPHAVEPHHWRTLTSCGALELSASGQRVAHAAVSAETAGAQRLGWNQQGDIYLHD